MKTITSVEFFSRVWPQALLTNETLELRTIDRKTNDIKRKFFTSAKDLLESSKKYKDRELYFGVSTRYGKGGKKQDCYRTCSMWIDLDGKRITDFEFPDPHPSIAVDSGGGLHLYWLFDSPVFVRNEKWRDIEAMNRGCCEKLSGDKAAIDISRILRIPGTLNHKYTPARTVRAYAL